MAKRNKKRRSRSKARQEPIAPQGKWKSLLQKLSSPTGIVVTAVSFFIAVVCAYFQFKAKLSMEPELPLKSDSDSMLNTPFRVTNDSFLPVYNVQQMWLLEKERYYTLDGKEVESVDAEAIGAPTGEPSGTPIPILHGSQSATLYPFDNVHATEARAKRVKLLAMIIYQTAIFHRRRQQNFYFEGNVAADGSFHWYPTSLPER